MRNGGLIVALVGVGLLIAQILFRSDIWSVHELPRGVRMAVASGSGELVALALALVGGFFFLKR